MLEERDNFTRDDFSTRLEKNKLKNMIIKIKEKKKLKKMIIKIKEKKKLQKKKKKSEREEVEDFSLKEIYYSLDGHNIFKRRHRYRYKIFLIICYGYLTFFNIADFIINIYLLATKPDYEKYDPVNRGLTLSLNMLNIFVILILTTFTVVKLRIKTYIYY